MSTTLTTPAITYAVLPPERWSELTPIFSAHGVAPPPPEGAVAMTAQDETGKIIAVLMLQPVLVADPLWIAEEGVGHVSFIKLVQGIDALLGQHRTRYFTLASPQTEPLCAFAGFTKCDASLWKKEAAQ